MTRITLPPHYKKFADKYLANGKIGEAAKYAGAKESSAHVTGSRWLKRPDILAYIAEQTEKAAQVDDSTSSLKDKVLSELSALAFANIADFITVNEHGEPVVDFTGATPEQMRAITSVATKRKTSRRKDGEVIEEQMSRFTMADKYRGLDLLGQHLGLFKSAEQKIVIDVADRLLTARQRYIDATSREAE